MDGLLYNLDEQIECSNRQNKINEIIEEKLIEIQTNPYEYIEDKEITKDNQYKVFTRGELMYEDNYATQHYNKNMLMLKMKIDYKDKTDRYKTIFENDLLFNIIEYGGHDSY